MARGHLRAARKRAALFLLRPRAPPWSCYTGQCTMPPPPTRGDTMQRELMLALARQAGLDKALADFPEDVAAAAAKAEGHRAAMNAPEYPAAEPWPPMQPAP